MRGLYILYVTTVAVTMGFFPAHIKMLQEEGHTVELACNLDKPLPPAVAQLGCAVHHIPFSRAPLSPDNLSAYRRLKKLLAKNRYDIVHTHTPNASALVRLACRKPRREGTKVLYTAHGFHFYNGAPLKNWLVYYPIERFLSRWTDGILTMNREDYAQAKQFHVGRAFYVHGVGIESDRFSDFSPEARQALRRELDVGPNDLLLIAVGELIPRKNHRLLIRALARLHDPQIKLVIVGSGAKDRLEDLAQSLGVSRSIRFLGYRTDIPALLQAADLFVFPSFQEGLPVSLMEAMAAGLPAVCSDIRGNRDLIEDGKGGLLRDPKDPDAFAAAIEKMLVHPGMRRGMGHYNRTAVQSFRTQRVLDELRYIYGIKGGEVCGRDQEAPAGAKAGAS